MIVKRITLTFLSILSSLILFPLILIVVLPLSLIRKCAIHFAKKERWIPLSAQSCLFVADDIYGEPRSNYLLLLLIEGPIFEEELRRRIHGLVDNKNKWPELTMSLVRWMGFYFWEPCTTFNFEDHLSFDRNCRTSADFHETCKKELTAPFVKGKPLWKFVIFPNYQDTEKNISSAMVIKCHHSLADGFGGSKLLQDLMDPDPELAMSYDVIREKGKTKMRTSVWRKLIFFLHLIFFFPIEIFYFIFDVIDSNPWTIPFRKQAKTLAISYNFDGVDVSRLKEIAKSCNQKVPIVVFDAVTSAMNRCMGSHGKDFTVAFPLPNPAHPGTLTNCLLPMLMKAPVSTSNRQQRQRQIAKQFRYKTFTAFPVGYLAAVYVEGLFNCLFNRELGNGNVVFSTAMLSNIVINFSGRPFRFFGSKVGTFSVMAGLQRKHNSVFITTFSYNEKLTFLVVADKKIFPDDKKARHFLDCIVDELTACDGDGMNCV